jgi:ADP-ribose pyrophosphatase YjhB (NUDIX family)
MSLYLTNIRAMTLRSRALARFHAAAHDTNMPTFERRIPDGDNRERMICADCGHIDYQNPKVVVGAVVTSGEQILMCRRAIEPRRGFWTLPAGYLELGETLEEGAIRETMEEATADIRLDGILGVFSVARIGQVQVIFRGRFATPESPKFAAGPESLEVALFAWDQIPWDEIAFPTVRWALNAWHERRSGPLGEPAVNPPGDPRGIHGITPTPSEPGSKLWEASR